jgi:hypothetical protein
VCVWEGGGGGLAPVDESLSKRRVQHFARLPNTRQEGKGGRIMVHVSYTLIEMMSRPCVGFRINP